LSTPAVLSSQFPDLSDMQIATIICRKAALQLNALPLPMIA
jgi:hypothetical protein